MAVLLTGWLWVRTNLVQKYLATGALSWELGSQLETVSQDVKAEAPDQVATFRCRCFDNGFECVSPQKSLGSTVLKRKPALASWQKGPFPPGSAQSRPAICDRMGGCPPGLESRCELISVWLLG